MNKLGSIFLGLFLMFVATTVVVVIVLYVDMKRTKPPASDITGIEMPHIAHMHIKDALVSDIDLETCQQVKFEVNSNSKNIFRIMLRNDDAKEDVSKLLGGRSVDDTPHRVTERNLGPGWVTTIIDNTAADAFWETYFDAKHAVRVVFYDIDPRFGAARADILRLALLYIYGGIYLDHKSSIIRSNFPVELPPGKTLGVAQWSCQTHLFPGGEFANWFFYAPKPGSHLLWIILTRIAKNIKVLQTKGPNSIPLFSEISGDTESISKRLVVAATGPIVSTQVLLQHPRTVDASYYTYLSYNAVTRGSRKIGAEHYSNQPESTFLQSWQQISNHIPQQLMMTYRSLEALPRAHLKTVQVLNTDLDLVLYDDPKCVEFLRKYFPPVVVSRFHQLEKGAHKADLFRYCWLYINGGYYADIKSDFLPNSLTSLRERIEPRTCHKSFATVIGQYMYKGTGFQRGDTGRDDRQLYNGIIITPSFNPILFAAIGHICKTRPRKYNTYIQYLYDLVESASTVKSLVPGLNDLIGGHNVYLAAEECVAHKDRRYSLFCQIKDVQTDTVILNTRVSSYGKKYDTVWI